ncbi:hypothetical protein AVEN_188385-1 [Araneus ventricosus]|uniref:Uncharacterized protein n=1 Tax=Araneus ventricosus TaxID=182803 RepID=A0A4Y2EBV1_ARAVE|nr:hypothetical protein AVEN_188385-1 [Araneus ventricosus]
MHCCKRLLNSSPPWAPPVEESEPTVGVNFCTLFTQKAIQIVDKERSGENLRGSSLRPFPYTADRAPTSNGLQHHSWPTLFPIVNYQFGLYVSEIYIFQLLHCHKVVWVKT